MLIDDIELIKTKDRSMKNKERKEKLTDEEKDARRERKLGRKRERIEENSSSEHKRRRDGKTNKVDYFYFLYLFMNFVIFSMTYFSTKW